MSPPPKPANRVEAASLDQADAIDGPALGQARLRSSDRAAPGSEHASRARAHPSPTDRAERLARAEAERARRLAIADADDTEALVALRSGNPRLFAAFARRYERPLFSFCLRMLGSRESAEDATQEVLLRVVKSVDRWSPSARVRTWAYAIARNHCIDSLRRARHRQTESLDRALSPSDPDGATLLDRIPDSGPGPDRAAASARARGPLVAALEALPTEQREVFLMREQAGLPFKEIAKIVGVPENTAKSRMRYALESLRSQLGAAGLDGED